jgi:hypothetical protein
MDPIESTGLMSASYDYERSKKRFKNLIKDVASVWLK